MVRIQEPQVLSIINVFQAISLLEVLSLLSERESACHQLLEQWCLAQACGQSCRDMLFWAHLLSVRSFAKSKVQIYCALCFLLFAPSLVLYS